MKVACFDLVHKLLSSPLLQEGGQPAEIVHGSQSSPHDKQDLL